ncbi:MAG: glycosyltransferase [Cytophagaceae bacterium]
MDSEICIIIPCYNEERRLPVSAFMEFISENNIHFCFVNDGSSDKTEKVLENIRNNNPEKVFVINLTKNVGKAEAIRSAINQMYKTGSYSYYGYLDADLATPLSELSHLYKPFTLSTSVKFVLGSRIKLLGRNVVRTAKRHYPGRVFATFASIALQLPVYDTQCGAKLFSSELIPLAFNEPFISSWLFDVELIARSKKHFEHTNIEDYIIEVPLYNWSEIKGSKVKFIHLLKAPFELLKIALKY